jgi:uncharacterized coiled-coil protein SlyX
MFTVDPFAVIATIIGLVALVMAIKRDRRRPPVVISKEGELTKRIVDLEEKAERQGSTIATLQTLLYEKQTEINDLKKRLRELERMAPPPNVDETPLETRRQVLWAGIGNDPMLRLDLAYLRRVQAQTRARLATLDPVTMKDLEAALDRERRNRTPIQFLHLGVHSDQDGLFFADGKVSWDWLSERLAGVQVLMLAGCSNDRLADKLRVVDTVVSVRGREIQNNDASQFVEAFWVAVFSPGVPSHSQAFEQALEIAPARVGEFVQLHL